MRPATGIDVAHGPACLTFYTHGEVFDSQEDIGLVGLCRSIDDGGNCTVDFMVDRALNDFVVPRNPLRPTVQMAAAGRRLSKRLDAEAGRRGQRVPVFSELGYR